MFECPSANHIYSLNLGSLIPKITIISFFFWRPFSRYRQVQFSPFSPDRGFIYLNEVWIKRKVLKICVQWYQPFPSVHFCCVQNNDWYLIVWNWYRIVLEICSEIVSISQIARGAILVSNSSRSDCVNLDVRLLQVFARRANRMEMFGEAKKMERNDGEV